MADAAGRRWPLLAALVAALVCGALGSVLGGPLMVGASALLAGAMAAIAAEDARRFRVPDAWNLAAALAGLAAAWRGLGPGLGDGVSAVSQALLAAVLCGGAFLLLREAYYRLRAVEGLGLGDVKLAATGGIWLGWELFSVAVMLAACAALIWVVGCRAVGREWPRDRKIPLGALLAPAIWACWYGAQVAVFG